LLDYRRGFEFSSPKTSRPARPSTTIQWVQLALSSEIKRPGCEANHSPPSSIEVKNYRSHISDPPRMLSWCVGKKGLASQRACRAGNTCSDLSFFSSITFTHTFISKIDFDNLFFDTSRRAILNK